jgi:hypothetical protein
MMNAELVAGGEVRIIIPIVYRANYLSALKGATHNHTYGALIKTLSFARRYTARVDFSAATPPRPTWPEPMPSTMRSRPSRPVSVSSSPDPVDAGQRRPRVRPGWPFPRERPVGWGSHEDHRSSAPPR